MCSTGAMMVRWGSFNHWLDNLEIEMDQGGG
jgi:hypothetical protein